MTLVRGPFDIKWGGNTIQDVEKTDVKYSVASDDHETMSGKTITVDGAQKVTVSLDLLSSDIGSLAIVLPQYFVPDGGILSTGETVTNAAGAIDVVPHACDEGLLYNDLDIISCGNPGQVFRIKHARTRIDGTPFDNKLGMVTVIFIGETESNEAVIQFFKENGIATIS